MTKGDLSPRKRRFVMAMLGARTVGEAAAAVGVSERTGLRYLQDPTVQQALGQALDGALAEAARRTVGEMGEALDTLAEIHRAPETPPAQRVSAARAIMDAGPRLREAFDLTQRVSALEQAAAEVLKIQAELDARLPGVEADGEAD